MSVPVLAKLLQGVARDAVHCGFQKQTFQALAAGTTGSSRRTFVSSSSTAAPPAAAAASVSGDLGGVLRGIEGVVAGGSASPKDIADAAFGLTLLQAKADRRLWGKVFEAASASASSFDAPSLATFLWAVNTAKVSHFKTLYDLAGPAAKVLPSATPAQQALIVEALGGAGVNDPQLFKAVAAGLAKASYSPGEAAKLLYGAAAAGVVEPGLVKAATAVLTSGAGDATAKDLAQAVWAYAKLGKADAGVLEALSRGLATKLGSAEATPQDAVAALWGFASLGHKPDTQTLAKSSALVKGGAADLNPEQAVWAAWSLAVLAQFDKDTLSSLFSAIGAAVMKSPDALSPKVLSALAEAQTLTLDRMGAQGPKLPEQVYNYSQDMYRLVQEAAAKKGGSSGALFKAGLAEAAARAAGARYRPEIKAAVAKLSGATADGLPVQFALELDPNTKIALLPVEDLSAGQVEAAKRLLDARGFKAAPVDRAGFEAQPDDKAKAKFVLASIKAAVPSVSGKVGALEKKLGEPFDPYAE